MNVVMICCLFSSRFSSAFLTASRLNSRRGSSSSAHLSTRKTSSTISARHEDEIAIGGLVPTAEPGEIAESDNFLRKQLQQAVRGSTIDHPLNSSDEALEVEESSTTEQIGPDTGIGIDNLQDFLTDKEITDSCPNKTKKVKIKETKDQSSKYPRDSKDIAVPQKKAAPYDVCADTVIELNLSEDMHSPVHLIPPVELEEKIQKAEKSFRKGKSKSTEISAIELPVKGTPRPATSVLPFDQFQGNLYDFSDVLNWDSDASSVEDMHGQDQTKEILSLANQTYEEDSPREVISVVNKTYLLGSEPDLESKTDQEKQERNHSGLKKQVEDLSVSSPSADAYCPITPQDLLDFAFLNEIVNEKSIEIMIPIIGVVGAETNDIIAQDMNQGNVFDSKIDYFIDDINVNYVNVVNEELEMIKIFNSVDSWDPCMPDQWSSSEINVFGDLKGSMESSSNSITNVESDFNLDSMTDSILYNSNNDIGLKIDTVGNKFLFVDFDNKICDDLSIDCVKNKKVFIANKEEKDSDVENIFHDDSISLSNSDNENDNIDRYSRKLNGKGSVKRQNDIDINNRRTYEESYSNNDMKNKNIKNDNGKEIKSDKQILSTNDKILHILLELEEKINCLEDELQDEKHRSAQLIQAFLKMEIDQDLLRAEFLEYKIKNIKDNRDFIVADDQ